MFGIGSTELTLIIIFGFLLFGPDKMPGLGRTLGRAIRQFREAEEGFTQVVKTELVDPINQAAQGTIEGKTKTVDRDDLDADLDADAQQSAPSAGETFAERKARMEAERRARMETPAEVEEEQADVDSDEDIVEHVEQAPEPRRRSARSLYDLDADLDVDVDESSDAATATTGEGEGA